MVQHTRVLDAHLRVTLLLAGGLEMRARLVRVVSQVAAHCPEDAAQLVVVLRQLTVCD
jgi:hypothetical protein